VLTLVRRWRSGSSMGYFVNSTAALTANTKNDGVLLS
jgi:hypothetical protein